MHFRKPSLCRIQQAQLRLCKLWPGTVLIFYMPLAPLQYKYKGLPLSSLHKNVVFSVCAHMGNAAYIISIMWNSISGLDTWYHFRFNISCGVAVTVRSHQKKYQVTF